MGRKKKQEDAGGGSNWMDTYGDLVTLLLCFFVLLYSFSSVDEGKWRALVASFSQTPSVAIEPLDADMILDQYNEKLAKDEFERMEDIITEFNLQYDKPPGEDAASSPGDIISTIDNSATLLEEWSQVKQDFDDLYMQLQAYVSENNLKNSLDLVKEDDEIVMRFKDNLLFDTAKADLKEESLTILEDVSGLLQGSEHAIQEVRIEGHADNRPIKNSKFDNNMQLSVARAYSVWENMVITEAFPIEKLGAMGYGETRPIATNDTEEGRAHNRRVELVVRRQTLYIPVSGGLNVPTGGLSPEIVEATE